MKYIFVALFSFYVFSDVSLETERTVLKGTVVNHETLTPIENAYIVITAGEEETLSTKAGAFILETSASLPISVSIQHPSYHAKELQIKEPSQLTQVRLVPR